MTGSPSDQELLEVRQFFGLPSVQLVEKDWHVIRAMQAISQVDAGIFRLVFAGGTCLARAHKLVQRMSEDVDFKVVLRGAAPTSANQWRKELGGLRDRVTAGLQAAGFDIDPANTAQVKSRDANRYTVYNLTAGPAGTHAAPLRASLLIELNHTQLRLPTVRLPVASFIAEAFSRPPEIAGIDCASVSETAAEKLVSLTRRTAMEIAGVSRAPDPTLVRHIHDLHRVRKHIDRAVVVALARTISVQDAGIRPSTPGLSRGHRRRDTQGLGVPERRPGRRRALQQLRGGHGLWPSKSVQGCHRDGVGNCRAGLAMTVQALKTL